MYQATDKYLKRLKALIRREFNRLSVRSFDELNPIVVKDETEDVFERLIGFNKGEYAGIAETAEEYALSLLTEEQREKAKKRPLYIDDYVEYLLTMYDHVTGYLYYPEAERKRLRLAEGMSTARQYGDRKMYSKALKRAADLWYTQSAQYAQDIEDAVVKEVWKRGGVKRVIWIAERDEKTCVVCQKLDNKIFDINHVPPKQHYHCRCIIKPI